MERNAIDILGPLPETPRKNNFILVVSDYFTKWTESYAIPNQEAVTVAEKLVSEFICRLAYPVNFTATKELTLNRRFLVKFASCWTLRKLAPLHCTLNLMDR